MSDEGPRLYLVPPTSNGTRPRARAGSTPPSIGAAADPRAGQAVPVAEAGDRLADRFVLRRLLGRGAIGAVYEAFDELGGTTVALKELQHVDPELLYRFKQEFRAVADVHHPNLITLYELVIADGRAFFTMELVDGVDFLTWVRPGDRLRLERLRAALPQLVDALAALHQLGHLHRDVKPTNVLVRPDGQVVLLDFGFIRGRNDGAALDGGALVGTPEYMSPEQAADLELTAASDWYALGVVLYEALTGEVPFAGLTGLAMLLAKQMGGVPPPSASTPGLPYDLDRICFELLQRDAGGRPDGRAILRMLGEERDPEGGEGLDPATEPFAFVGRGPLLERLQAVFHATRGARSGARVLCLHGPSGVGKSTLLRHFLHRLSGSQYAVVLEGRCHERETVPYRALDSLIDGLARFLVTLPADALPAVVPDEWRALTRVFPVLRTVGIGDGLAELPSHAQDPVEVRRLATQALRQLLRRMADRVPLVVAIDDMQWCDADGADVLADLVRPDGAPAMLLILAARGPVRVPDGEPPATAAGGTAASVPAVASASRELAAARGARPRTEPGAAGSGDTAPFARLIERLVQQPGLHVESLAIGPMTEDEATVLAAGLLGPGDPEGLRMRAAMIAREAEGHPLFVAELARHARAVLDADGVSREHAPELSLEGVTAARVARLSGHARRILELVAAAGRPIAQGVVLQASHDIQQGIASIAQLRARNFVRTVGVAEADPIEVYHDRIRVAVLDAMPSEAQRATHLALAHALEERRSDDVEALALHFEAAGLPARATAYAERAADLAFEQLAFNRAARLYRQVLRQPRAGGGDGDAASAAVWARLGVSLASDGHGAEAAHAFREAARRSSGARALELERRAADQLLRSGHVDEGLTGLRRSFAALGMRLPRSPRGALVRFAIRRAWLHTRGWGYTPRRLGEVPQAELLRIDTCWAAATGLSSVNVFLGQDLQMRHMILALQCGEPARVARALAMEALYSAISGEPGRARTAVLLKRVHQLAADIDQPHAIALADIADGAADIYRGRFAAALPKLRRAEGMLRDRCADVSWELSMARTFVLLAQFYLGELRAIGQQVELLLDDAQRRDDLHAMLMLRVAYKVPALLAEDDARAARVDLQECVDRWWPTLSAPTFRYVLALSQGRIERYAGDGEAALRRLDEHWPAIEGSLMLFKQPYRIFMLFARGITLVHAARGGREREARLRRAHTDARRLAAERTVWGSALAGLVFGGVQAGRGLDAAAIATFSDAAQALGRLDMPLYAAAAERRAGELMGGAAGRARVDAADATMEAAGVADPGRMAAVFAPPVADG